MCTNGPGSAMLMPAKARRTGKPSPSKPLGAVVMSFTGRSVDPSALGLVIRVRSVQISGVMVGIASSFNVVVAVTSILVERLREIVGQCTGRRTGRDRLTRETSHAKFSLHR